MRKQLILLAMMAAVAACSKKEPETKPEVATNPVVNIPAEPAAKIPMPTIEVPDRVDRLLSSPATNKVEEVGPSLSLKTDSPQEFVDSLQAIERVASKQKVDDLRAALTLLQIQTQKKIVEMASGMKTTPQFSDQQLMEIAFGEINGMTTDQVIQHARKIGPEVLDR